jgi:hypothetical protein
MPVPMLIPLALVEVALNAAVMPFSAVLLTLFTLDLRVRYEGLDMEPAAPATV